MRKVAIIIQARTTSTRFPRKVFAPLVDDLSVLQYLVNTCAKLADTIVTVPCTQLREFQAHLRGYKVEISYGHEEDNLLDRYHKAFWHHDQYDAFIRITADCPVIPSFVIEQAIEALQKHDYVTNTIRRTMPDGFDIQGISRRLWDSYRSRINEEHLFYELETKFLGDFFDQYPDLYPDQNYSLHHLMAENERLIPNPWHPDNKLSIDTEVDLERVRKYIENLRRAGEQRLGTEH